MVERDPSSNTGSITPHAITPSRRQFLQAIGLAGLAGAVSSGTAVGAPKTSSNGGPGSVSNLSEYIENPGVYAENQEPAHAPTAVPFDSVSAARSANTHFDELETRLDDSPYYRLLNGEWDFAFFESPNDVPTEYSGTSFDTIDVPLSWHLAGYDEYVYVNTPLTWTDIDGASADPPNVPDSYNPVGVYRRQFDVPDDWDSRKTFLSFEGVKQAYFVWIDGQYVGYDQGSMTTGEFDITDHVTPGESHQVTVQVYRFSDAEPLETQDMFRYAGIFRSVSLYSTPTVRLRDWFVRTELDENYENATLTVDAEIANYTESSQGNHTIRGHLFDSDGSKVTTLETSDSIGSSTSTALSMDTTVAGPDTWTAEDPTLYTLVFEHEVDGATTETVFEQVGFREYSISDAQFRVNGQPVDIRGVNKHETDPDHGRYVPHDRVREDFELMKRSNINAFRCSHYPNDPSIYYLADEYGLYVQDEVNVETHWNTNYLGESDNSDEQAVERFVRMIGRDKNRPCIFTWSTGNEAGLHDAHYDMAEFKTGEDQDDDGSVLEEYPFEPTIDPTRFLYHQANNGGIAPFAPIDGPRYPSPGAMRSRAIGSSVPIIMGEYAHAMGNSGGLFHDFWDYAQPDHETVTKTVFADESDAGNTGTVIGDSRIVDENDGAIVFENDGYVDVGTDSSLDFTEPGFTLWARVKDEGTDDDDPYITRGDNQYALKIVPGDPTPSLQFFIYDDGYQVLNVPVPEGWTEGEGYHDLVGVATDSTLKLFVDGELLGETPHNASTLAPTDYSYPVTIGYNAQADRYTDASISQVRVYDRALSNSEVASAASDTSPPSSAVLWMDFAQPTRNTELERYEEYDPLQGGFVWDWVDQAVNRELTSSDAPAASYRFYDGNPFCLNGVIFEERTPQPQFEQLKKSHQPVGVVGSDLVDGTVRITNHLDFANLSTLNTTWELQAGEEVVESGTLAPNIAPSESTEVTVPFEKPTLEPGVEYWLTLRFKTTEDTVWADAGHQLAFDQLQIPFEVPEPSTVETRDMSALSVSEDDGQFSVSGDGFEYIFSRERGTLVSAICDGTEIVADGPQLDFFRAPIQNEIQGWGAAESDEWYNLGLDDLQHEVASVDLTRTEDSVVRIAVETSVLGSGTNAGFDTQYRYKVFGSGDILLGVDIEPTQALVDGISHWLPRIGVAMDIPNDLDQFEWFGRGPHETYPDRKWGAEIDVYEDSVADQFVAYQPPSDNGNKADTRWAALTNDDGVGLVSFAHPKMHVNINRYQNLAEADHVYELEEKEEVTTIHLDHVVTGVGGTPIPTLQQYQVSPEPMTFLFGFRPLESKRTGPPEHANNDGKKQRGPPGHANNDGEKRRGPPDHANDDAESPMELSRRRLPRSWVNFQQG